jgi:hypothetical protein
MPRKPRKGQEVPARGAECPKGGETQPPAPLSSEAPPSGSSPIDAPASILEATPSGSPPIDAPAPDSSRIDAGASILEESGVDASDDESVGDQEHEQSPAQSAAASTIAAALAAAAHADQATAKKKVQQIHWSFKPAARTFFRIIEAVKPKGMNIPATETSSIATLDGS